MSNNEELITRFYEAFSKGDAAGMVACYTDDVLFTDPAFGELRGEDAKDMWRMLMERSKGEIRVTFNKIAADNHKGSANWRADYIFTSTGRPVVNLVKARFEFRDGKISRHTDRFNFWRWSSQALGMKGLLLGWTPFLHAKVTATTRQLLKDYKKKTRGAGL